MIKLTDHDASFVFASSNSDKSSAEVEHELLSLSSDSWTDAATPSSQIRVFLLLFKGLLSTCVACGRSN